MIRGDGVNCRKAVFFRRVVLMHMSKKIHGPGWKKNLKEGRKGLSRRRTYIVDLN